MLTPLLLDQSWIQKNTNPKTLFESRASGTVWRQGLQAMTGRRQSSHRTREHRQRGKISAASREEPASKQPITHQWTDIYWAGLVEKQVKNYAPDTNLLPCPTTLYQSRKWHCQWSSDRLRSIQPIVCFLTVAKSVASAEEYKTGQTCSYIQISLQPTEPVDVSTSKAPYGQEFQC